MEFKVLGDEEMDLVQEGLPLERVPDDFFEAIELSKRQIKALKKAVAQEAQKDTLRQVLEMVEGIENPYRDYQYKTSTVGEIVAIARAEEHFDEALQTIKQPLRQAIEKKE